ncbi:MAG: hypothetical protein HY074_10890 [Deltaproteobacteria bacterium]|nr:hypothetical protein [Deltaproteobacteria bacterium]
MAYEEGAHRVLEVESTNVHLWEGRNFRLVKGEFQVSEAEASVNSPVLLKRAWVMLNGVKRLCPIDVPITVALWQLGQRRFEDALFCHDGSCHLCEVVVNGEAALACKTLVRDGQEIMFGAKTARMTNPLCPCKQVSAADYKTLGADGVPEKIVREISGVGHGTCHGRWCLASNEFASESAAASGEKKLRPMFHGYEASPWRDIWASDVAEADPADNASDNDSEL